MSGRALEFPARDGSPLKGLWRVPEGPGPFPAVLCVHGLTLSKALFDEAAEALAQRGVASLRMDLRGHGGSGGRLEEQGFGDQCADVLKGMETLAGLDEAGAGRLGMLGFSMGGSMAVRVARSAGCKALALWSPLLKTSLWNGLRKDEYGAPKDGLRPIWDGIWVSERLFTEAMDPEPFGVAASWPGPLFVCHGAKDKNHPQSASVDLAQTRAAAALSVASYFPPSSGHRWHPEPDRRLRDALTAAFFSATL